jgi:hypothetical protein
MMSLGRPRPQPVFELASGPEDAPILRISGLGAVDICLSCKQIRQATFLRIGEALFGAEVGWMIFQRDADAVACSVDSSGVISALRGPFGAWLEASRRINTAEAAIEAKPLRRARAVGVVQLDLPTLGSILSASTTTGRGVKIDDLPTIS